MGQLPSQEVHDNLESFQEEIKRHARSITEFATLSYDDLQACINDLNKISECCMDAEGKQLQFYIQKNSKSTLLWRSEVRIICKKYNSETGELEKEKIMNLNQFLKVYRSIKMQFEAVSDQSRVELCEEATGGMNEPNLNKTLLMKDLDLAVGGNSECCICFERPQEILLPCLHSFCQLCIQRWNSNSHTCPICREKMGNNVDAWVIFDTPNGLEIGENLVSSVMDVMDIDDDDDDHE